MLRTIFPWEWPNNSNMYLEHFRSFMLIPANGRRRQPPLLAKQAVAMPNSSPLMMKRVWRSLLKLQTLLVVVVVVPLLLQHIRAKSITNILGEIHQKLKPLKTPPKTENCTRQTGLKQHKLRSTPDYCKFCRPDSSLLSTTILQRNSTQECCQISSSKTAHMTIDLLLPRGQNPLSYCTLNTVSLPIKANKVITNSLAQQHHVFQHG